MIASLIIESKPFVSHYETLCVANDSVYTVYTSLYNQITQHGGVRLTIDGNLM